MIPGTPNSHNINALPIEHLLSRPFAGVPGV